MVNVFVRTFPSLVALGFTASMDFLTYQSSSRGVATDAILLPMDQALNEELSSYSLSFSGILFVILLFVFVVDERMSVCFLSILRRSLFSSQSKAHNRKTTRRKGSIQSLSKHVLFT